MVSINTNISSLLAQNNTRQVNNELEKAMERLIRTPCRTNIRIRSPRLAASGRQNKVGKGSRQNRSVTSGKGLALRAGSRGLGLEAFGGLRVAPSRVGEPLTAGL